MKNKKEKGFALVLSLVLLMAMSLMGGALIVISASDHQSNNLSDEYQQTFYVAETALLEGEKYIINIIYIHFASNAISILIQECASCNRGQIIHLFTELDMP